MVIQVRTQTIEKRILQRSTGLQVLHPGLICNLITFAENCLRRPITVASSASSVVGLAINSTAGTQIYDSISRGSPKLKVALLSLTSFQVMLEFSSLCMKA